MEKTLSQKNAFKNIQQNLNTSKKEERNIGIDLLRIVSIFMVLTLHILGHGGILNSTIPFSLNHNLTWILEIACYGAVNIFAITTGYVYINSKHKWSKIIELWFKVFFYSAGITILFKLLSPEKVTTLQLLKAFLPIISRQYWYFSAYFGLFLFIPFLNTLILALTKNKHKLLLCIITITFVGLGWLSNLFNLDIFNLASGYSFLWLVSLYFIGAYIKLYQSDFKKIDKNKHLLFYLIGILISFITCTLGQFVVNKIIGNVEIRHFLIYYISPLTTFNSIQIFLYFSKLKFKKRKKIINKLSVLSFGVYLFSEQTLIRHTFITGKFNSFSTLPWHEMLLKIIITCFVVYIISTLIEWCRDYIFKKIHISRICENLLLIIKKINNYFKTKISIFLY